MSLSEKFKMVALVLSQEEKLSEIVKQYHCLYDKTSKGYKEKDAVNNAWREVANEVEFAENG